MYNWQVEINIGNVDIYDLELVSKWGGCFPGEPAEFENWSEKDKKEVLNIAHRDQGKSDRLHSDPGFTINLEFMILLGQCILSGNTFCSFYDYLLAGLPSGYVDMIVENYFPKYAEERGL